MLDISPEALAVITGSWTPLVQVDAWYDGELVLESVPWTACNVDEDATQAILASGSCTAAAPDDSLIPVSWDSPLACYGSQLHIRVGVPIPGRDTEWFSHGWFPISDFDCTDWWREIELGDGTTVWAPQGTQVQNSLADRWELIDQATFAVPEQPASLTSVIAEIERLADTIVAVDDYTAITDAAVPDTVTYSDSRAQAIQDLAAVLARKARMSRDGTLALVPLLPAGGPLWTVTVTDDELVARILTYARKGDRAGLYNQFISSGTSPGGTPVQAVGTTTTGPLRFGGPFGQAPYRNDSPLITTVDAAQADVAVQQAQVGGGQTVLIPATVPFHPALETDDVIALNLPGGLSLSGPVQTIARVLGAVTMDVQVKVSREQLWGVHA